MSFRDLTASTPLAVLAVAVDEAIARAAVRNAARALEVERARRLRWAVEENGLRLAPRAQRAALMPLPRTGS